MNEDLNIYNGGYGEIQPDPAADAPAPIWAAITSFVLSIVNIFSCCCCYYIALPLSLTFGIVSLLRKWRGKGLAIAGIVISLMSGSLLLYSNIRYKEEAEDLVKLYQNPDKYISMYDETGTIPEEFEKYRDPKYDNWWYVFSCNDFDEFYGRIINEYFKKALGNTGNGNPNSGEDTEETTKETTKTPDNYGETPVNI